MLEVPIESPDRRTNDALHGHFVQQRLQLDCIQRICGASVGGVLNSLCGRCRGRRQLPAIGSALCRALLSSRKNCVRSTLLLSQSSNTAQYRAKTTALNGIDEDRVWTAVSCQQAWGRAMLLGGRRPYLRLLVLWPPQIRVHKAGRAPQRVGNASVPSGGSIATSRFCAGLGF